MMLQMQQLGMRAMTMYQPAVSAFINSTNAMERAARESAFGPLRNRAQNVR